MLKAISSFMQMFQSTGVLIDAKDVADEAFLQVFQRLDKKTLCNCILTCHRFHDLISNDAFWVEHARIKEIPNVLPSLKWRRAAAHKNFERDENSEIDVSGFIFNFKRIVLNGRGYSPIIPTSFVSHFENARDHTVRGRMGSNEYEINSGAGIIMEDNGGHGCEPHPDVSKCFTFSYTAGSIVHFVDLARSGIDEWVLDHVRPKIRISQKVNHRHDCSARLTFAAQLCYNGTQWIREFGHAQVAESTNKKRYKSINKEWAQWTEANWEDEVIEFDDYPSGMRHLAIRNEGQDGMFWRGFYGPKIANLKVEIILPDTPIIHSLLTDTEQCAEDDTPLNPENERDRHQLRLRRPHMWAVPPAVAREQPDDD